MRPLGIFFLYISLFFHYSLESKSKIDTDKVDVWGPGLNPVKVVFPVHYFFLHLYDIKGNKLTESPDGDLDVHISGDSNEGGRCRIRSNILNRKDGSFIIRYKVDNMCNNLHIDLRYNNLPIKGFPKKFSGRVLPDDCNCPQYLDKWLRDMECKSSYSQIDNDLSRFKKMNFKKVLKKVKEKFNHPGSISLCHYVIKNNEIYRSCLGEYVGFKVFMDAILHSLARKIWLPNIEFIVNLGDWPLEKNLSSPLPIFSWCGSESTADIVMPTYDLTEATLKCMDRVMLDMLSVQGNTGPSWSDKITKAFWRGRDSCPERLDLIKLSKEHPDLFNASLTNFFFFQDKEKEYGPKVQHISFFDFFKFKYQVTIDGTVAAYRLPYLLAGDSVVLKQDSPYYEHFYRDLVPNVHYVPFKRNLSDLVEKIQWLMNNDDEAQKIAQRAQLFVRENLMPKDVFCYHAVLFKNWEFKLKNTPEVLSDMEKVPQVEPRHSCKCRDEKDEL